MQQPLRYMEQFEHEQEIALRKTLINFPSKLLPSSIENFIEEQSLALGCPSDFIGLSVLAATSVAIGNSRKIELKKNWQEGATLYCGIVAEPGSKKTAAISKSLKPLYDIQAENKREYDNLMIHYSMQEEKYISDLENWKKQLRGKNFSSKMEDAPVPPSKPIFEQIITVDTTMESLQELMSINQRGVIQYRDELVSFVKSMNQYRSGADRQYWLSMWSNEPIIVNRKGKDAIEIPQPFCNVIGGIQPEVLEDLISGNKNDGFLDRFLFVYPKPINALWSEHDITDEVNESYSKIIKSVYESPFVKGSPLITKLSPAAKEIFADWYDNTTKESSATSLSGSLKGVYEKLKGQCARLMLIIHTLRWASGDTEEELLVDDTTASHACFMVDAYFKPHLFRVFNYMELSEQERFAEKVVNRIKDKGDTNNGVLCIRMNDLNKAKICGRKTNKETVYKLLEYMEKEGYGTIVSELINGNVSVYFFLNENV
jgi:Protein of unknown function (DUF3987)